MISGFSLLLAWREGKAQIRRHALHVAAVAVGVSALVSLSSIRMDVEEGIRTEARTLLGGDLRISSSAPFPAAALEVVDSLRALGVRTAHSTTFGTMVANPDRQTSRFLQIRALSEGYPLYGEVQDDPPGSWDRLGGGRVLVDPQVLDQLDVRVGERLRFGSIEVRVVGVVEGLPPETGFRAAFGASVFASAADVDEAGLLEAGSVAQRRIDLRVPGTMEGEVVARELRTRLRSDLVSVRSAEERTEGLVEGVAFLGGFLGLVGFSALLLGAIGVGSAAHAHLEEKVASMAVLRHLGAREHQVFAGFLVQAAVLALAGAAAGVVVGLALQWAAAGALSSLAGVELSAGLHPGPVLAGFLGGVWFAFLFSAAPLAAVRNVPPRRLLRRGLEERDSGRALLGLLPLAAASVLAGALWVAPSTGVALGYAGGLLAVCSLLLVVARILMAAGRRLLPSDASFGIRHGIAGLFRPRNQTAAAVLALGVGVFLLAATATVETSLLGRIAAEEAAGGPNLVLFDIRPDQRSRVARLIRQESGESADFHPIVPARIASIRDRTVADLLDDPEAELPGWTLRRVYRNTYRADLGPGEELVRGRWWSVGGGEGGDTASALGGSRDGTVRVSVEEELATELGLRLGDTIGWDVQGVPVRSEVTSIRRVNWYRFRPNFFVVFEPGPLESAPQTFLVALDVPSRAARSSIQSIVAAELPGVAVLDFAQVRETLDGIIARVSWGVRGLALFTLVAGILVLGGVAAAHRRRKLGETALLRTLGARRRALVIHLATEYAVLGAVAGLAGAVLGALAAALLVRYQFGFPLVLSSGRLLALWLGSVVVAVLVGVAGTRSLLAAPPLPVLRREAE